MAQPQYTPAQVLETARRAEADGQIEYADQAFRHILEVFPSSREAVLAREAIANRQQIHNAAVDRLQNKATSLSDALQPQTRVPPQATITNHQAPLPHTAQPQQNAHADGQTNNHAQARAPGTNLQLEPMSGTETTSRSAGFPQPYQRNYPVARLLATVTVILGILTLLAAVLVGVTSVVMPTTTQVLTGTPLLIPNILFSASIMGSGLILCLVGLIAHAVFHTARNLTTYTAAEHSRLKRRDP